jgi:transposase
LTTLSKAKVEACVLIVERWLIGRLRDRRFYSLAELNAAIGELLKRLNEERPIRRLGVTRRQLFEELDRPALKPLPSEPYVFAEWRVRRVGIDYHVEVEGHFYSVPYRFARSEVDASRRTLDARDEGSVVARFAVRGYGFQYSNAGAGRGRAPRQCHGPQPPFSK